MNFLTMDDVDLKHKRVLIREDLNVPLTKSGQVANDKRILAALPTIRKALAAQAKVMICSHLGRPVEGEYDPAFSLLPVAEVLAQHLGQEVPLVKDWLDGVELAPGKVVLLENVRFNRGEEENSEELSLKMAKLCDVFVMDAFGTAHRKQASTYGVAQFAPIACAGPLLTAEITALNQALENPVRPMVAIIGGSKVSSKLEVLASLAKKVDRLIVGGGIANTFIAAAGLSVGNSLYEPELLSLARSLIKEIQNRGGDLPLPIDVVVAKNLAEDAPATIKPISKVEERDMILDIGPDSAKSFCKVLADAGTILWNGPIGVFEYEQFSAGTKALAKAIAESPAFSLAGGGETLAAIDKFGVADKISYISTGGGAFLEFVEGKILPAIEILSKRATQTI